MLDFCWWCLLGRLDTDTLQTMEKWNTRHINKCNNSIIELLPMMTNHNKSQIPLGHNSQMKESTKHTFCFWKYMFDHFRPPRPLASIISFHVWASSHVVFVSFVDYSFFWLLEKTRFTFCFVMFDSRLLFVDFPCLNCWSFICHRWCFILNLWADMLFVLVSVLLCVIPMQLIRRMENRCEYMHCHSPMDIQKWQIENRT